MRLLRVIINSYIIAVPLTVMMLSFYFAVHSGGIFCIDMTTKDEYLLEVGMTMVWFILILYKGKSIFKSIMQS